MSSPADAEDESDKGATGGQPMLQPEMSHHELLADLSLLDIPAELPRWSMGHGWEDPEDPPPPGVTVTRRGAREKRRGREELECRLDQAEKTLVEVSERLSTATRYEGDQGGEASRRSQATTPPTQPLSAQWLAAAGGAPGVGFAPGRRPLPPLDVKFGGNPRDLGFYLVQVGSYMAEFEREFTSEAAKVRCVTRTLEGLAADWVVTLYNDNSPQLRTLDGFMFALRRRFEDPLAERRARLKMKTLVQGGRSVADYTQEFRQLAYHIRGWSEGALVEAYKDGLNADVYHYCISRRDPRDLQSWYLLAEEVDIDLIRSRRKGGFFWGRTPPPRSHDTPNPRKGGPMGRGTSTTCFRCGKEGHRMADCRTKMDQRRAREPVKKSERPPAKPRETGLKIGEVVEVAPPPREELGPPTCSDEGETDPEDNVPVSPPRGPMTFPIKLKVPTSEIEGEMLALLDSGCTRCVINMKVVKGLGIGLRTLRTPISFCQLDGSEAGGCPARFITEPLQMTMGSHREILCFIVAPGMEQPLILGLPWLRKWNPLVNWRGGWLRIHDDQPPEGEEQPYPEVEREPQPKLPVPGNQLYPEEEDKPRHEFPVPAETVSVGSERLEGEEKIPKEYRDLKDVFSETASDELPPHRSTDCSIEFLPGVKLPKPKLYSMTPGELEELRAFIDKNLKRGFITPARPRVAAPVMFREKKDGSKRLVVDYRNLNAVSVENVYPLPLMKDMIAHLAKGKIFTKLDLREAYYRVRIKKGDEWKTAFNCPLGCFQFNVLPFGLQGAPAVFMQLINQVLHEHLYKGVLVYLDDILIYTETKLEHVKLVRSVLHKLRAAQLYAKLSKCEFHQEKIDYLGYRISPEGIEMDPDKVRAVLDWAPPRTRKQLQSFLGFANFYRQFIPSFAQIAMPITNLLKTKGEVKPKPSQPLQWTMECQAAFEKLKRLFAAEPVLKHPEMDNPFIIQADASDVAVGAVLLQLNEKGILQPCAYTSRKLTDTERRWAVWEKEAFAVRWALLTWRHFLEGAKQPFEVWTDHKNLEALKTPRKLSPKQVRWAQFFKRFNFSLKYIPGGKNFMADALSRMPQYNSVRKEMIKPIIPNTQLAAPVVTRAQKKQQEQSLPTGLTEKFKEALKSDEWFRANVNTCTVRDGLAWIGAKLYVPQTLRSQVLQQTHDSKVAGHFGFVKTLHLVKRQFWWPALKKDIETYVASCPICASAKRPPGKPPGMLQNVARPTAPWKEISMDFIVDLPESAGQTVIWVVTDLFSKQAHFIPCSKIPSAKSLAKMFIVHVYKLHGVPERVISDRGVQFTSQFWREFLNLIGSSQSLSSAHHPQTNGACERTNGVLEQYLRCYINYQQDNWVDLLPFAEVAYNNSVHSSTGFTPFKVATGQDFVPIPELPREKSNIQSLDDWISQLQQNWPIARKALDEAHQSHKRFADKKRAPQKTYHVGDKVFLSTKYLQTTQKSKKLGPKYVGPFPIERIINPVTVQLTLPKTLRRIHPVFHVSLLKPEHTCALRPVEADPPVPLLIEGEQHFEIKDILDSRKCRGRTQYLVVWKHFPPSHAEWVNDKDIKAPRLLKEFYDKYPDKP